MLVHVVDSGMGNVGSLISMMHRIGVEAVPARSGRDLAGARRVVLPGVGSFDRGIAGLRTGGLWEALDGLARSGCPVLGICLGMQLMAQGSDEGVQPGFGWLPVRVERMRPGPEPSGFRLPHMGWASVRVERAGVLFEPGAADQRFYFAHSFAIAAEGGDRAAVATAEHGRRFVAAFELGNLMGVQFHPEKSHRFGRRLLERFVLGADRA